MTVGIGNPGKSELAESVESIFARATWSAVAQPRDRVGLQRDWPPVLAARTSTKSPPPSNCASISANLLRFPRTYGSASVR